jgi:hypothetical protein
MFHICCAVVKAPCVKFVPNLVSRNIGEVQLKQKFQTFVVKMMNTENSFKQKRRTDATRELPAKKIICLSRSRPVLCLARGLPRDHNATTAILEIPEGAPHGLLLICSHSACAKSQRRFRYCKGKNVRKSNPAMTDV